MKKSDMTKQKILKAATNQFSQKGLYGARIDEIAAEAQINKRMLYEYFGNKESLYAHVLENVYQDLNEEEDLVFSGNGDYEEALRSIIATYFRFLSNHPEFVRMLMWENLYEARHFDAMELGKVRDPLRRALRALLEQGKREGRFRADADEQQVLMTLFACPFNFFSNIHTMSRVMQTDLSADGMIEARAEAVIDMMLAYLAADGKRALQ